MKKAFVLFFCFIFSEVSFSLSLAQNFLLAHSTVILCEIYAEEVGGDVEAFRNMNLEMFRVAEVLGYSNDFKEYNSRIRLVQKSILGGLREKFDDEYEIYNGYCVVAYNMYIDGLNNYKEEMRF